ncbi:MAG: hypothetical protein MRZ79_24495 [Bacteroidia bacterium]|nr:hypothetical protein [Bacteroidia bacterium]
MTFFKRLNKYIPYWPLIPFYTLCIIFLSSATELAGDEHRYLKYANRLLMGNYAGDPDNPDLINGPGWPLVIAFFSMLKIPVYWIRFFNVFFLWGSVVYVNKILKIFGEGPKVVILTLVFALYPPFILKTIPFLYSEVLALLMVSAFCYFFIKIHYLGKDSKVNFFIASLTLGLLILTRVQFSYIAIVGILMGIAYSIISRNQKGIQTSLILALSMVVCMPYLSYTYQLTGKLFYGGTNGGEQFYWMSAPYEGQWGNWVSPMDVDTLRHKFPEEQVEFVLGNEELTFIETNDRYVEAAVENIKNHPEAYAKNYVANIGRMLFNFPHTYEPQKLDTYFFIISNIFFLFCLFMSLIPLYFHWKKVPYSIVALALFSLMYLGGTSLMAAINRYVVLTLPFITVWLGFVAEKFVVIKIKQDVN